MAKRKRKAAGTDGLPPKRRRVKNNQEPKYPKASFLGIPGELRNSIYRYALLKPSEIIISPTNHHYPNLIKVSKQIYHEARDIYMKENKFEFEVIDYTPIAPPYDGPHWLFRYTTNPGVVFIGGHRSWANLKEWIRLCSARRAMGIGIEIPPPHIATQVKMALRAFNILSHSKSLPWSQLEPVLEEFKMATEEAGFAWT